MKVFCLLHPFAKVDLPPFVFDFHLETKFILDRESFIFALVHSPRLCFNGLSSIVYELLRYYFVLNDFVSGFDLFFETCGHISQSLVPPLISCLFSTFRLLVLEEQFVGIRPIMIDGVTCRLVVRTLVIHILVKHLSFH
jgi:hypothetical protein